MASVLKLAGQLDQPVNKEVEFQVFHLQHGYAAQVARSITDFYRTPRALGTSVNVFADPRTNSIIVQARPRDLEEVDGPILQLDSQTASQATIKIFPLQNGDATSISRLLETLFGTAQQQAAADSRADREDKGRDRARDNSRGPRGRRPAAGSDAAPRSRSTFARTALSPWVRRRPLQAVEAVILRLDNSDVHTRKTTVVRLKNNAADNVRAGADRFRRHRSAQLQQIDPEAMSSIELLEGEVFVVAEPVSNSLLLMPRRATTTNSSK